MREMPKPETYEEGLDYWPYRKSLAYVFEQVVATAPVSSRLLDIMCGPGSLLARIRKHRKDLELYGVDVDQRYVEYGRSNNPGITFVKGDVLDWQADRRFDTVVCTGALHHIPYLRQEGAVANIANLVKPGGRVIISDCYVDSYKTEMERQIAAAKLGYEYLVETIANGAPHKVVEWTIDILYNDVLSYEYKMSLEERCRILDKRFTSHTFEKIWPENGPRKSGYGDYVHVCTL